MTLLPQVRDQLGHAAKQRAGSASPRWRGGRATARTVIVVVVAVVPVAIVVGVLGLLHGTAKPAPTTKPPGPTTIQQFVNTLAVLRRPQTKADRAQSPDSVFGGGPDIGIAVHVGTPDLPLERLATVTPWGQKVIIAPMKPISRSEVTQLERRYPAARSAFQHRPPQKVTLGLFGKGGPRSAQSRTSRPAKSRSTTAAAASSDSMDQVRPSAS